MASVAASSDPLLVVASASGSDVSPGLAPIPEDEAERLADLRAMHILGTPPEQRFDQIVDLARRTLHVSAAMISLIDSQWQYYKARVGFDEQRTPRGRSICSHCIVHDVPLIIDDIRQDARFRNDPDLAASGFRYYAGYPLKGPRGHNVGTFCVMDPRPHALGPEGLEVVAALSQMAEQQLNLVDVIGAQRELLEMKNQLVAARQREAQDLADAADLVRSMLPVKLDGGDDPPIRTDYAFINSFSLGGDLFGYQPLRDGSGRLALYVLDVMGHGVSAALLSVSIFQALRREAIAADFADPASVLGAMNAAYPMAEQGGRFFTLWYGVYDHAGRTLRYAAGGHPPAIVVDAARRARSLDSDGLIVGAFPDTRYVNTDATLAPGDRLYLYSDGTFEVRRRGGGPMLMIDGLKRIIAEAPTDSPSTVGAITAAIRAYQGRDEFADDYSLLEVRL